MVSIHAPARGATAQVSSSPATLRVSIHAPARGATAMYRSTIHTTEFQSTPLREGRPHCLYWHGQGG